LGEVFRSKSDTEVVLRGYGVWGPKVLERLRGMFGIAIHDARRGTVLLARDRLGIKPLYYAEVQRPTGRALVFASELRALLATDLVPRRLNPAGLGSYLWNGFVVGPQTMVRGIHLLPAGASMLVSVASPRVSAERYWSLTPETNLSARDAVERLESELLTAVRQHLVSDVPLGVFLSGGVDSSAIASLAVRSGSAKVQTFHVGFEEVDYDESAYARRVAQGLGTEHVEFRLTQNRFRNQLSDALASLDQPTFDAINTYFVSRVVRDAGFTVALAGTGGDELFGGYRSFRDLPWAGRVGRALRTVPEGGLRAASRWLSRRGRRAPGDMAPQTRWGKLGDLLAARGDRVASYQVAYALFTGEFLRELAAPDTLAQAPHGLPMERASELLHAVARGDVRTSVSVLELALFIGERLLRDSDAASMAVSLELRVPLLDHRVVEAALAVPERERFAPLGKKMLLRKLAMPNLDPSIFERPKRGFVLPIELWAKDQLSSDIQARFENRELVESAGLRPDALGRLWNGFRAGAPGLYWSRVWAPYVLLEWCRAHRVTM
jgi:asparagine synthase (glutamine-hydrolysing)